MAEDIRELKQDEMVKVAGGKVQDDHKPVPQYQTTRPYCRGCRNPIQMIGGYYVCDTIGCIYLSEPKTAKEVNWH